MDFWNVLSKRRSYRRPFLNRPVPHEHLRLIVNAGLSAPSGRNAQTTQFVIVQDPKLLHALGRMHRTNKAMQQAQAYIVCVIDAEPAPVHNGLSFQVEDCAAAVENMLLAIAALGYASVWVDGWLRVHDRAAIIGNRLGVPEDKRVRVVLPIGVPAETTERPPKSSFDNRVSFDRYKW